MSVVEKINQGYKDFQLKMMMGMIDHTLLKPDTTIDEIKRHCDEAIRYGFKSVCVFPEQVRLCRKLLKKTDIGITTVVGFPFGENETKTKVVEAKLAFRAGATEVDMVACLSNIKRHKFRLVRADIEAVVRAAKKRPVKVIIEISKLTDKEIEKVIKCCIDANADFVKTSTGFIGEPTTLEQVIKLNKIVDGSMEIKAAGGITSAPQMLALCEAGATRIGTSHAVEIANEFMTNKELLHVGNMEEKAEEIDKEREVVEAELEESLLAEGELKEEKLDRSLDEEVEEKKEKKGFFAFFKRKPKKENKEEVVEESTEEINEAEVNEEVEDILKEEDLDTNAIVDEVFETQDANKEEEQELVDETDEDEVASEEDIKDLYQIDGAEAFSFESYDENEEAEESEETADEEKELEEV